MTKRILVFACGVLALAACGNDTSPRAVDPVRTTLSTVAQSRTTAVADPPATEVLPEPQIDTANSTPEYVPETHTITAVPSTSARSTSAPSASAPAENPCDSASVDTLRAAGNLPADMTFDAPQCSGDYAFMHSQVSETAPQRTGYLFRYDGGWSMIDSGSGFDCKARDGVPDTDAAALGCG